MQYLVRLILKVDLVPLVRPMPWLAFTLPLQVARSVVDRIDRYIRIRNAK